MSEDQLLKACKSLNLDCIRDVFNQKISPSKELFERCIMDSVNPVYIVITHGSHDKSNLIAQMIDLFISYGYELTYQDVIRLIRRGLYVNDISKFNFQFDDDFYHACELKCYWPYYPTLPIKIDNILDVIIHADKCTLKQIQESSIPIPSCVEIIKYMMNLNIHQYNINDAINNIYTIFPITVDELFKIAQINRVPLNDEEVNIPSQPLRYKLLMANTFNMLTKKVEL